MDRIVYRLTLDAKKGGIQRTLQGFICGESLARKIAINIVSNGTPLTLTEKQVAVMYVIKPNMMEPSVNSCSVEDNQIVYDVLQTDIDAEGIVKMQLKVIDDDKVILSPIFALEVSKSEADDTEATGTPTYTALEKALIKAEEVYNSRVVDITLEEDKVFRVYYADETVYESEALAAVLASEAAELDRVKAELQRAEAEVQREEAEKAREIAESERKKKYAAMVADFETFCNDVKYVDGVLCLMHDEEVLARLPLVEGTISVDTEMSETSVNAIANNAVTKAIKNGSISQSAVGKVGYIAYPYGGLLRSSSTKGRIRITLPKSTDGRHTIRFTVKIYNHSANEGIADYDISIYTNTENNLPNVKGVVSIGNIEVASLPVRFASDGTDNIVTIGNDDSFWAYPIIAITDIVTSGSYDMWRSGWNIAITSDNSDLTISDTVENPYMNYGYASQASVDSIQTTSQATLSTAGWYRVAEYVGTEHAINGSFANSCGLIIKRHFGETNNEQHFLWLDSIFGVQKFKPLSSLGNRQLFTKVRYAKDATNKKAFIEVYYNSDAENKAKFIINNAIDTDYSWQAITPTLTEETVDGVTVTTTYDIPANASPVTDLDLKNDTYLKIISSDISSEDPNTTRLPRIRIKHANCPTSDVLYIVDTIFTDNTYEGNEKYQIAQGTGGNAYLGFRAKAYGGTWGAWQTLATTADLANCLPKTGGLLSGSLYQYNNSAVKLRYGLQNSLRQVELLLSDSGNLGLCDNTNGTDILKSTIDGTNTFYGTATRNLPLTGGQIDSSSREMLKLNNTADTFSGIGFYGKGTKYGEIVVSQYGLVFKNSSNVQKTIHHDGNSLKVQIGNEEASIDDDAFWVVTE